ncbi:MAG: hypothetical protein GY740_24695 [Gammaproteobacteria bacterium]|nr:hypothetical protein [Gammaproteobacteria bacterium]
MTLEMSFFFFSALLQAASSFKNIKYASGNEKERGLIWKNALSGQEKGVRLSCAYEKERG